VADGAIAVVSVVASGVVGALGVIVPALTARGNRKHDRHVREEEQRAAERQRVWERRADAYQDALAIASAVHSAARARNAQEIPTDGVYEMQGRVLLWSSEPVREAWARFVATFPENFQRVTDDDADAVRNAAHALIEAVNSELGAA